MGYATDDLAPLLTPSNRAGGVSYGQGTLLAFDSATFSNVVSYRGAVLTDLPLLAGVAALGLKAGDIVALMSWRGSYLILGNTIAPGAGQADALIQQMQDTFVEQLVTEIAPAVIADRVLADFQSGTVTSTAVNTYQDLGSGPTVSGVDITSKGKAVVIVTSRIFSASGAVGGNMGFVVSGATSLAAADARSVYAEDPTTTTGGNYFRSSAMILVEGLNAGTHTFDARYRSSFSGTSYAKFADRHMVVIAF